MKKRGMDRRTEISHVVGKIAVEFSRGKSWRCRFEVLSTADSEQLGGQMWYVTTRIQLNNTLQAFLPGSTD